MNMAKGSRLADEIMQQYNMRKFYEIKKKKKEEKRRKQDESKSNK